MRLPSLEFLARAICILGTALLLASCIPQQEAILRIENISDGMASLQRLGGLFARLGYQDELVYSLQNQQMSRVAIEKNGNVAMAFRSRTYEKAQIVARYHANQSALEIKFLEAPVSTEDFRFSPDAIRQFEKLLDGLRVEFGADRIVVERPAK